MYFCFEQFLYVFFPIKAAGFLSTHKQNKETKGMQTLLLNTIHWVFAQKACINDNNTFLLLCLYYFVFEASNQCIFPDIKSPEISIMPDSAPAVDIMANKNYAQ